MCQHCGKMIHFKTEKARPNFKVGERAIIQPINPKTQLPARPIYTKPILNFLQVQVGHDDVVNAFQTEDAIYLEQS